MDGRRSWRERLILERPRFLPIQVTFFFMDAGMPSVSALSHAQPLGFLSGALRNLSATRWSLGPSVAVTSRCETSFELSTSSNLLLPNMERYLGIVR